jgi:phosphoglycolate phosphatase-like HAD superfamily hydrolase
VLASSASERELKVLENVLAVPDAIDFTTSSDDADSSKPAPDILEAALSKASLTSDRAVFVGDAVWDVLAASKAGLQCIGLECGGTSAAELRDAGAVAVYQDPADLLASFESSPLSA